MDGTERDPGHVDMYHYNYHMCCAVQLVPQRIIARRLSDPVLLGTKKNKKNNIRATVSASHIITSTCYTVFPICFCFSLLWLDCYTLIDTVSSMLS